MKIDEAQNIYIGSTEAQRVYLGSTIVWEKTSPQQCSISGRLSSYARDAGVTYINLVLNYDGSSGSSWDNREEMQVNVDTNGYFDITYFGSNITTPITSTVDIFSDNLNVGVYSYSSSLLESLSFSADTSHVEYFDIDEQRYLTTLNIRDLNLSNAVLLDFNGCSSLTTIDMTGCRINASILEEITFSECSSLTTIVWPVFSSTPQLSTLQYMFGDCSSLTTIDLRIFDLTQAALLTACFENCSSLTTLYLPEIRNLSSTYKQHCFNGCSSLRDIYVTHQSTLNCITNTLSSEGDNYAPSTATIHYNNVDYTWNGTAWTSQ